MKFEIPINLVGTLPVPRAIICLLNQGLISISDFGWYMIFLTQADFGHAYGNYAIVTKSDKVIAKEILKNESTVFKARKKLIKVGILKTVDRKTLVSNFDLFNKKNKVSINVLSQTDGEEKQKILANYFIDNERYMQKQKDFIEKRRRDWLEKI